MSRKTRRAKGRAKPKLWQSPLLLEEVQEVDPEGRKVTLYRVVDTIGKMHRAGTIGEAMVEAGRKFERHFILAQLDPLRVPDVGLNGFAESTAAAWLGSRDCRWVDIPLVGRARGVRWQPPRGDVG